ncbi:helix-turn-helix transcriptional regulator [Kallotenue papyrolyticum]|uniref:helix-turn-helix transcriptional regulator n=1 Tax=Kallotenue papyrolyticum TaxID=1325125 RepID=UPI000478560C|nr:helix-turn-helix transcriptional regulator [Kallotenue papyrolyticum]
MSPRHQAALAIEHALLGWLLHESLHGYELHQRLQDAAALGLVWRLKQAHLYALLGKLLAAGLIAPAAAEHAAESGGRLRRPLRITEAGRRAFAAWVVAPVEHGRELRLEFLAKLFWAHRLGPATTQRLIEAQRRACRGWLAQLDAELERTPVEQPYARLVLTFRRNQINASLAWLDTCATGVASEATARLGP